MNQKVAWNFNFLMCKFYMKILIINFFPDQRKALCNERSLTKRPGDKISGNRFHHDCYLLLSLAVLESVTFSILLVWYLLRVYRTT